MNADLNFSTNLLWKLCGWKSYQNKERVLFYERGLLHHTNTYRENWNCGVSQRRGMCVCFNILGKTTLYLHQPILVRDKMCGPDNHVMYVFDTMTLELNSLNFKTDIGTSSIMPNIPLCFCLYQKSWTPVIFFFLLNGLLYHFSVLNCIISCSIIFLKTFIMLSRALDLWPPCSH